MKMRHFLVFVALGLMVNFGCSKKDDDDDSLAVSDATELSQDAELSSELVNTQLDDIVDSLASGDMSNSSLSLALADTDITKTRTCETKDKTAVVTLKVDGSKTIETAKVTNQLTITSTETRTWSNDNLNDGISCITTGELAGKYPKILWNNINYVNGLKLVIDLNKTFTHTLTVTTTSGTKTKSSNLTKKGNRTIQWAIAQGESDVTESTKTISFDMSLNKTFTKFNSQQKDISAQHKTLQDKNLVVITTRESDGDPLTHTIKSGTIAATANDKFYTTTEFDNLKYNLQATDPCTPVSGKVTIKMYQSESDTNPLKTIVITFADTITATVDGQANTEIPEYVGAYKACSFKIGE